MTSPIARDMAALGVDRGGELHRFGRAPALQQRGIDIVHLDPQRLARRQRIAAVRPATRNRQVAAGTVGDRAEQVYLGKELEEVALLRRAGLREVDLVLGVEAGDLEDVQDVVHVELGQVVGRDRAGQVVVAGQVELGGVLQLVQVRIAPGAQQVVAASPRRRRRARQRVVGEGQDRPEIGQARPQTLAGGHVRALELTRARRPEALARVVKVPRVEVADLRPLEGHDATEPALADGPRPAGPDGNDDRLDPRAAARLAEALIEGEIDGNQPGVLGVVVQPWWHRASSRRYYTPTLKATEAT